MSLPLILLIVFCSSLVLTMIGLGGGLIFSPLFVLLNFPKDMAVSASLFLNGTAAISAAIVYIKKKMVDFSVALPLIVTASLGAPLGALATHRINVRIFLTVLAGVIFIAAMRMLFSGQAKEEVAEIGKWRKIFGGCLIGLAIGFISGMLGIGGGVFVVPLLIYILKVPTKTAAASSMFIVCFSSTSGFITHAAISSLDWKFILLAALFSFTAGQIGSRIMAEKLRGKTIRRMFGVVLLLFCAKLLQKAYMG